MKENKVSPLKKITPSAWLMRQTNLARQWINFAIFLGFLNALLLILQLHYFSTIINAVFLHHATQKNILAGLAIILGLLFLRSCLSWLKEISGFQVSATIRQRLRLKIVEKLQMLGPILSQQTHSGEWLTTAWERVEALHGFFSHYLPQMWLCILSPLLIISVIFSINWLAGIILLITAPLIPIFMALVGIGAASINKKNFQTLSVMSAHFLDILQGLNTLKLFNQSKPKISEIYQVAEDYRKTTMQTLRIAFLSSGVLEFFAAGSIALLAIYLGLTLLGHVHIGRAMNFYQAFFIVLLAPEFFSPLRELAIHYHARAAAVGAAEEIMAILSLETEPEVKNHLSTKQENISQLGLYHIECRQLNFAYVSAGCPVLSDLNLILSTGEHLAIVGESGSGKSTLLHLLLGFLQPTTGEILLNGKLLSSYNLSDWRANIGYLAQRTYLFPGTIRENLLMANSLASETDMWQALKQVYLFEEIKNLSRGLDTRISEQNVGLSGGQAQRLALARIYLRNPPVLLLDEPTTYLDQHNRILIMESLQHFWIGKTVILLTHQLDILSKMDRVLLLKQGKLQEAIE